MFNVLSNFSLTTIWAKMCHEKNYRDLLKLIEEGDYVELKSWGKEIVEYIDYEMRNETDNYLMYQIGSHKDHTKGRVLFQIFKSVCDEMSPYHWSEIMALMGQSLMRGSVEIQNIKLLEHAMCHVDEIYLERLLHEIDAPEVSKWYDENFIVT